MSRFNPGPQMKSAVSPDTTQSMKAGGEMNLAQQGIDVEMAKLGARKKEMQLGAAVEQQKLTQGRTQHLEGLIAAKQSQESEQAATKENYANLAQTRSEEATKERTFKAGENQANRDAEEAIFNRGKKFQLELEGVQSAGETATGDVLAAALKDELRLRGEISNLGADVTIARTAAGKDITEARLATGNLNRHALDEIDKATRIKARLESVVGPESEIGLREQMDAHAEGLDRWDVTYGIDSGSLDFWSGRFLYHGLGYERFGEDMENTLRGVLNWTPFAPFVEPTSGAADVRTLIENTDITGPRHVKTRANMIANSLVSMFKESVGFEGNDKKLHGILRDVYSGEMGVDELRTALKEKDIKISAWQFGQFTHIVNTQFRALRNKYAPFTGDAGLEPENYNARLVLNLAGQSASRKITDLRHESQINLYEAINAKTSGQDRYMDLPGAENLVDYLIEEGFDTDSIPEIAKLLLEGQEVETSTQSLADLIAEQTALEGTAQRGLDLSALEAQQAGTEARAKAYEDMLKGMNP